ncbi:MAG: hypothetical protein N3B13_06775, partial [Deltaproteobacteria bacterium]|nr:hypothetical protein [Deltaproteobacteria bacterium]
MNNRLKRFILESKILFNRMSLRTRLFLAFVILIVSSASATIFIGITVFTNKVEELAYSKVAVDLKLVEHTYNSIIDKLRLLSRILAEKEGIEEVKEVFVNDFVSDIPVDFLIMGYRDKNIYFTKRNGPGGKNIHSEILAPSVIEKSPLSSFMEYVSRNSGAVSSNIILPSKLSYHLFGFERDLLAVVSGIKNGYGDVVVLGIEINHKSELADRLK